VSYVWEMSESGDPVERDQALAGDLASGLLHARLGEIAEAAAALILPYWRTGVEAMHKADDSPVTEADQKAEALILERLAQYYPGVLTVAEEASARDGLPTGAAARFFLIDPLDGTRGFVAGRESFTVNIALIEDGAPVAGAVVAPATGLSWRTTPDGAVRREAGGDWTAIGVRTRPREGGVAVVSHSAGDEECAELSGQHGCVRWEGVDSSLKFCLIAQGDYDAYPRTGPTSEWDTAAGHAVLKAAGGRVLAPDGRELAYGKPRFLNGPFVALGGA
jgi:3'(2'), 5'-bisphosphate nucleotidase